MIFETERAQLECNRASFVITGHILHCCATKQSSGTFQGHRVGHQVPSRGTGLAIRILAPAHEVAEATQEMGSSGAWDATQQMGSIARMPHKRWTSPPLGMPQNEVHKRWAVAALGTRASRRSSASGGAEAAQEAADSEQDSEDEYMRGEEDKQQDGPDPEEEEFLRELAQLAPAAAASTVAAPAGEIWSSSKQRHLSFARKAQPAPTAAASSAAALAEKDSFTDLGMQMP
eukprot:scaffold60067_cov19-Tisochrysis_lutea.AAC.2